MKRGSRHIAPARVAMTAPLYRVVIALLCIMAFGLQGYIAQAHIHVPRTNDSVFSVPLAAVAATAKKTPALPNQDQGQDDPSKCPLCQVATSLSTALGVSTLLITVPAAQLAIEPLAFLAAVPDSPPSYAWRNRGPPRR
ncbi:MAG TPA: DUF2946 family protein [Rhizomicrobium sp.]